MGTLLLIINTNNFHPCRHPFDAGWLEEASRSRTQLLSSPLPTHTPPPECNTLDRSTTKSHLNGSVTEKANQMLKEFLLLNLPIIQVLVYDKMWSLKTQFIFDCFNRKMYMQIREKTRAQFHRMASAQILVKHNKNAPTGIRLTAHVPSYMYHL